MPQRRTYIIGFVITLTLLLFSLYLQFYKGVMPCPLCSLQRAAFAGLGVLFLLGIFLCRFFWPRIIINIFLTCTSMLGIFLASRQIWLQHFPSADNNECGVSLEYMAKVLPWKEMLQKVLAGSAECSARGWEFLYLNMAEWALIWFVIFFLITLHLLFRELTWQRKR